ncbi:YjbH domain-containing protein [Gemmobacter denitrificans]|uniref:YjbH domain-containing protein n=1 Tax=Gemmobacter denitrificans TaxID=3123040 RepID=A0ABU8BVF0_9RHOB
MLTTTALAMLLPASAHSEDRVPSLNFYGAPGLLDMPSGEAMPDGYLSTSSAHFGPISRTTLSFQITPRLSGSFRFLGIRDWNAQSACQPDCGNGTGVNQFPTYYDRSFDLRYKLLDEGRYVPDVTVGFQDFVGTGILSAEYIAATKHLTPDVKVTLGLGWGRLGSYGSIGSPLGERDPVDVGEGGKFNFGQWFRGPMAPFGGIEWQVNDKLSFKAEYSSDAYDIEAAERGTFDRRSPVSFGVEYRPNDWMRVGGYYAYGSEVGFAAHFLLDPDKRPIGSIQDSAPRTIQARPSRSSGPEAWSGEWAGAENVNTTLIGNLNRVLKDDGITVEALGHTAGTVQVRINNRRNDAEAQAIGRVARALANALPASVERFEIVPLVNGSPASKVTMLRTDLERLEHSPDAARAMQAATTITQPGPAMPGLSYEPELYPSFSWAVTPYQRLRLFDQREPLKGDLGLRVSLRYDIAPGWVLAGSATKKIVGNLDDPPPDVATGLQPVRSDIDLYDANGDPALESLYLAKYAYLGGDFHGRATLGYLERMYAGVSTEVLYLPQGRNWAIGAELNYVAQRDTDGKFGFSEYDYRVLTGHVSGYYKFADKYHAQIDVGRYLAGDIGATISLDREFANGWRVGAFATKTNVSEEDFGSGSFDKGIRLEIPFAWGLGRPTRKSAEAVIRPFGRDGGQRIEVEGRLYETLRDYRDSGINEQWGRFWK